MTGWRELLVVILLRLYVLLLRLYPRPFREAFAEEMVEVFARHMEEMAHAGFGRLFRSCLQEYVDLTRLLLDERWKQLQQEGRVMNWPIDSLPASPSPLGSSGTPSSWPGALLAGLPHLMAPVFFLTGWLLHTFHIWGREPDRDAMEIGFSILVAVMLLVAWRRGWPRWSGSWAGYASASLFILLLSGLSFLFKTYPALIESAAVVENVPILAWLLSSFVMVVLFARRDALAGLLAILSVQVLLNHIFLDEVRGDEPLFLGLALAAAVVAMLVARAKHVLVGLGLVLAYSVPMVLLGSYYSIYRSTTLPVEPNPSMVMRQSIIGLIMFALWLIPILLLFAWRRVQRWRMSP